MSDSQIQYRRWLLAGVIAAAGFFGVPAIGGEIAVTSRITYEIADGFYVNAGTDQGLASGLAGSLRLDDGRTVDFEVLHVSRQSALLRLRGGLDGQSLLNQTVELAFQPIPPEVQHDVKQESTSTRPADSEAQDQSPGTSSADEFVPLLTPLKRTPVFTGPRNVSHGRVQVRQMYQTDSQSGLDYLVTRMNGSGSVERLSGSPWSFEWSGNLRYRSGDGYSSHEQYQAPQLSLYEAVFQRPLDGEGFLRLGRFLPRELPGIGPVDGLQSELRPGERLRIGAVAGLKPSRIDLAASSQEPLAVAYTTLEAGAPDRAYYSGTMGLLGSLYDGEMNRLALLFDQRAGLDPDLRLYATGEVDFDVGAAQTRSGMRLTRLNAYAVSKVTSAIRLRGGVDHWERPDNLAERELLSVDDDRFFDNGYWRYWVGSNQSLGKALRLSEEVSYIYSDSRDGDVRWRVGATRTGLFNFSDASLTFTVYNLIGAGGDGYGGRLSGYLPLLERKLVVQPSAGFRMFETDPEAGDFTLTYLSLNLDGRISESWRLQGGATYTFGDEVDSSLFELGLRYSW